MRDPRRVTAELELHPGRVLEERYELAELIGEGGFAAVFEAWDRRVGREVAVKVLDARLVARDAATRDRLLARFRREASVAAQINHPGVVAIFDFGFVGDRAEHPFIVMERLRGRDLEEQLSTRGAMAPERALPMFVDALDALGEVHDLGVVHKDLKPGNLFVCNPGEPDESLRVVDFGVAFMANAAEGRLTATGELLGTPHYIAPEYINEQIASPALDVYQMGLILLEMLTGERVVDADTAMRCILTHITGDLPVPQALVDSPLGPILSLALALDHEQRFANGKAFANALRSVDPSTLPKLGGERDRMVISLTRSSLRLDLNTEAIDSPPSAAGDRTLLGIGRVDEGQVEAFLEEAKRTGWLSARQTSRLLEIEEALAPSPPQIASRVGRHAAVADRETGAQQHPVAEDQAPNAAADSRAMSMWEFRGDVLAEDPAGELTMLEEAGRPEAHRAGGGPSSAVFVVIAMVALGLAAAGWFFLR